MGLKFCMDSRYQKNAFALDHRRDPLATVNYKNSDLKHGRNFVRPDFLKIQIKKFELKLCFYSELLKR